MNQQPPTDQETKRVSTPPTEELPIQVQALLNHQLFGTSCKYDIGYKTILLTDRTRSYQYELEDKLTSIDRRPLIAYIWYPTTEPTQQMQFANYFDPEIDEAILSDSDDQESNRLIQNWVDDYQTYSERKYRHTLDNQIQKQMIDFQKEEIEYDEEVIRQEYEHKVKALWHYRIAVTKQPQPFGTDLPVIIYHHGAGSSPIDNHIVCEYLASQGFVVIAASFQNHEEPDLGTADYKTALADIQVILSQKENIINADWTNIMMLGHSLGAQNLLVTITNPDIPINHGFSLDTTQDYVEIHSNTWNFVEEVLQERDTTGSVVFAARKDAIFQLGMKLEQLNRYFLTFSKLSHDQYITIGHIGFLMMGYGSPIDEFTSLVDQIRSYMQTRTVDVTAPLPDSVNVELYPGGATGADVDITYSKPTALQLFHYIITKDTDRVIAVLNELQHQLGDQVTGLLTSNFAKSIITHFSYRGDDNQASRYFKYFESLLETRLYSAYFSTFLIDQRFKQLDITEDLEAFYNLDPDNREQLKSAWKTFLDNIVVLS